MIEIINGISDGEETQEGFSRFRDLVCAFYSNHPNYPFPQDTEVTTVLFHLT